MAQRRAARTTPAREPDPPAAPAEKPEVDPNMRLDPSGFITWRLGPTDYHLRPLKALEFMELDWRRMAGADDVLIALTEARNLPLGTKEEREARRAAMEEANAQNSEWILGWWELLFEHAEMDGRPFPREEAPAALFRPRSMMAVLAHLQGPPLPGGN